MDLIKITVVSQELNEQGQKKLDDFEYGEPEEEKDDYGRTAAWYKEAELPVPKHFQNKTLSDFIDLDVFEDYDYYFSAGYFKKEQFKAVVDHVDFGSIVYTQEINFRVKETARQIINKLNK